jgi:hypothetical protein
MSKHTPGPWTLQIPGKRFYEAEIVAPTLGNRDMVHTIADVPNGMNLNSYDETALANARLMTSAPELLALLQEIARAGTANARAAKDLVKERLAAGFFADVRAAIAKATGENSGRAQNGQGVDNG